METIEVGLKFHVNYFRVCLDLNLPNIKLCLLSNVGEFKWKEGGKLEKSNKKGENLNKNEYEEEKRKNVLLSCKII